MWNIPNMSFNGAALIISIISLVECGLDVMKFRTYSDTLVHVFLRQQEKYGLHSYHLCVHTLPKKLCY